MRYQAVPMYEGSRSWHVVDEQDRLCYSHGKAKCEAVAEFLNDPRLMEFEGIKARFTLIEKEEGVKDDG